SRRRPSTLSLFSSLPRTPAARPGRPRAATRVDIHSRPPRDRPSRRTLLLPIRDAAFHRDAGSRALRRDEEIHSFWLAPPPIRRSWAAPSVWASGPKAALRISKRPAVERREVSGCSRAFVRGPHAAHGRPSEARRFRFSAEARSPLARCAVAKATP